MGLRFPDDLGAWQRWQDSRHPARVLKAALRRTPHGPAAAWVARNTADEAQVVAVLESRAASSRMAVLEPLRHLAAEPLAVVAAFDPGEFLPGDWSVTRVERFDPAVALPDARVVLSAAHYLELGALVFADAVRRGVPYATVQHGLLTPSAPPLPDVGHLLAWSQADAGFWLSGRRDVAVTVVGSQLLWNAAAQDAAHVSRFARPTYLGQLHGAELPRAGMTRAVTEFCLETGARYRPHPSETDRLSVLQHRVWERMGIEIDRSGAPLSQTMSPVVSAFSTGVLEAAARGVPAWVSYPRPPAWLGEFWERYRMSPWGGTPTPIADVPATEPGRAVADWLKGRL